MKTLLIILIIYFGQIFVSCIINTFNNTRTPLNFKDFLKLTPLPWLLLNLKKVQ